MLTNMLDSMNRYLAIGIISIFFGLMHVLGDSISLIGLLNVTLLGAIVGIYFVQTRSLWMPLVFHAGWNYFQGVIFGFKVSGVTFGYSVLEINLTGSELLTGGAFGFEGSIVLTLITIPAIILFEMNSKKKLATGISS